MKTEREQDILHIRNCLKNFLRQHPTSEEQKKMVDDIMNKILTLKENVPKEKNR